MSSSVWIFNLAVLLIVLEADLGRRIINGWRVLRPLIVVAVIVPLFLKAPQGSGHGLELEVGLGALGIAFGLIASVGLMRVGRDPVTGRLASQAGLPYAALWFAVIGARLIFAIGANHWYTTELGEWLRETAITNDALTDALVFMAMAMALTRSVRLGIALKGGDRAAELPYAPAGAKMASGPLDRLPVHRLLARSRLDR